MKQRWWSKLPGTSTITHEPGPTAILAQTVGPFHSSPACVAGLSATSRLDVPRKDPAPLVMPRQVPDHRPLVTVLLALLEVQVKEFLTLERPRDQASGKQELQAPGLQTSMTFTWPPGSVLTWVHTGRRKDPIGMDGF